MLMTEADLHRFMEYSDRHIAALAERTDAAERRRDQALHLLREVLIEGPRLPPDMAARITKFLNIVDADRTIHS